MNMGIKTSSKELVSSLNFALRGIAHPRRVGTFLQTPEDVAEKIAQEVSGKNVVEFGPGLGAITYKILERLPTDGRLYCFELDPYFYKELAKKIKDPRFTIFLKSAEYLEQEVANFDCIVSGLPLTALERSVAEMILEVSKKAKRFIQYKYFPSAKMLENYFKNIREEKAGIYIIYVCDNK